MPAWVDVRGGVVEEDFDLVVIGSGPAGEKGATQAAYYGYRVAVVERRADPGGSAIAVSGVPVKALRDAAVYLTGWSRRDVFGIGLSLSPELAMDRLRAHVTDVVTTMTWAVRENLVRHSIQLMHGDASLGPGRTVVVRGDDGHERTLRARVILIATGSRPHHPPGLPFDDPDVHDSETVLSIDRLPERLVVVGGGPVGTEYASIFSALGVEV
ncbi:MAG TPA: FAD-dependent oxidoreductase, partial [Motilibacterales bacterium]|nr:FAD-dependent oxidoreductase [Motilibacterales bacterium]